MSKRISDNDSIAFYKIVMESATSNWPLALEVAHRNIITLRNSGSVPEKRLKRLESLLKEGPDVCTYVLLADTQESKALRACGVFSGIPDKGR